MIAIGLSLIAYAAAAQAQPYVVAGPGTQTCGKWSAAMRERDDTDRYILSAWVAGYITAADMLRTGVGRPSVLTSTDMQAIEGWVSSYCTTHPLDHLSVAAEQLLIELVRRQTP